MAPPIPNFGTNWRWVVDFTLRPVYPRVKSNRYRWNRRLGGCQSQSGWLRRDKSLTCTGIWTQDRPTHSLTHTHTHSLHLALFCTAPPPAIFQVPTAMLTKSEICYSTAIRIQSSQRQQPPKRRYLDAYLHGVTAQRVEYSVLPPYCMSIFRRVRKKHIYTQNDS